ncbi:exportin [Anaeramoeba flamelloides]|uniref:Exportin n=1 Tax=Anaeramoeba flamelloides TaxID=1746091 RepID=A0AAV7YDK5_9EUKA|nr:exportin [Anaeramoeba flamelloides]
MITLKTLETLTSDLFGNVLNNEREEIEKFLNKEIPTKLRFIEFFLQTLPLTDQDSLQFYLGKKLEYHLTNKVELNQEEQLKLMNFLLCYLKNQKKKKYFVIQKILQNISIIINTWWQNTFQLEITHIFNNHFFDEFDDLETQKLFYQCFNLVVEQFQIHTIETETLLEYKEKAISFSETFLLQVLQMSFNSLHQLLSQVITFDARLLELILDLQCKILSFDYNGDKLIKLADKNSSLVNFHLDNEIILVPKKWGSVLYNSNLIQLLFQLYDGSEMMGSKILKVLSFLASLDSNQFDLIIKNNDRNSVNNDDNNINKNNNNNHNIHKNEHEKITFYQIFIDELLNILNNNRVIEYDSNIHQFSRILYKLLLTTKLIDLYHLDNFLLFLEKIMILTIHTSENFELFNSEYYLLKFWSKVSDSIGTFTNKEDPKPIRMLLNKILHSFIFSIIGQFKEEEKDREQGQEQEQGQGQEKMKNQKEYEFNFGEDHRFLINLNSMISIIHSDYPLSIELLLELFAEIKKNYQKMIKNNSNDPEFKYLNIQLSIIIYLFSFSMGRKGMNYLNLNENVELDSKMINEIIIFIEWNESFFLQTNFSNYESIEISILKFLQKLNMHYLKSTNKSHSIIFENINKLTNLDDQSKFIFLILNKIINNLKSSNSSLPIIESSLQLFDDLATNYSTSQIILKIENIENLFENHHNFQFGFFQINDETSKCRSIFYKILTKLIFREENKMILTSRFLSFIAPFQTVATRIIKFLNSNTRVDQNYTLIIIGFIKDITGIVKACQDRLSFNLIFNWIYPDIIQIFTHILIHFLNLTPIIAKKCLKFWNELTNNAKNRIKFESSSPNGIYLFKEVLNSIYQYSLKLEQNFESVNNTNTLQLILLLQQILFRALSGNYINLGVFEIYKENILENTIKIILKLSLQINYSQLLNLPDLYHNFYSLISILFKLLIQHLIQLDSDSFNTILNYLLDGIALPEIEINNYCFLSLQNLLQFYKRYHLNKYCKNNKKLQWASDLHTHINYKNEFFFLNLLNSLFHLLVFNHKFDDSQIFDLFFSLINTFPSNFVQIKDLLLKKLPTQDHQQISNLFELFFNRIENFNNSSDVNKFKIHLYSFRKEIRKFDLNIK